MPKYMFKKGEPHILNYNPAFLSNSDIFVLPDDFNAVYHAEMCKEYGHRNVYVNDRFETAIREGAVSSKTGKPHKNKQQESTEIKSEKPDERFTVKVTMPDHFENDKLGSAINLPISIKNVKELKTDELKKLAARMGIEVKTYESRMAIIKKVEKRLGDNDISATPKQS